MLWVLLVFVVLLAGLIAYVADNVARRVGRRHIRLFGLRPKTTALIYAVATGMGISFLSMVGFALINQQAIITISKAEQYRKELQELQTQIAPLRKNKAELEKALKDTQNQVVTLSTERTEALKARDSLKQESDRLKGEVSELKEYRVALEAQNQKLNSRADDLFQQGQALEQSIRKLEQGIQALEDKNVSLEAQNKNLQASYDKMVGDLQTERANYQKIQQQYQQAVSQYQGAQQQVKQISPTINRLRSEQQSLKNEQQNLKKENETLKKARQAAQNEVSGLQYLRAQLIKESEDLKQDNAQLRASLKQMTREISDLRTESAQLKASLDQQRTELEARRTEDAIFEKGDLVFQGVYQANEGGDALDRAVRQAELKAISRGARGKPSAILIGADQLSALSQNLRAYNGEVLVVVRATNNQIKGFPVSVDMQVVENKVLYVRDQPIRSRLINVGSNGVKTNRELTQFLQTLALDTIKALQEQGIPLENLPSELSTADAVNMVNSLKNLKGSVLVGMVARSDVKPGTRVEIYPRILR